MASESYSLYITLFYYHESESQNIGDEGSSVGRVLLPELLPVPGVGGHSPGAEEHEREGKKPETGLALDACAES